MMTHRFFNRRNAAACMAALVMTLVVPAPVLACWYTCTAKYGYRRSIDGESYVLVSCSQTWPDDARGPITNCVYAEE